MDIVCSFLYVGNPEGLIASWDSYLSVVVSVVVFVLQLSRYSLMLRDTPGLSCRHAPGHPQSLYMQRARRTTREYDSLHTTLYMEPGLYEFGREVRIRLGPPGTAKV